MNDILGATGAALLPHLLEITGASLLAVGTFAVKRLADWLRISADDQVRRYLLGAVEVAVDAAQSAILLQVRRSSEPGAAPSREAAVADAAGYVLGRVPDAAARLRLGRDALREIIEQRLRARGV